VAEGAAFVIGPLAKSAVATLARRRELEVPVLSLNYLPEDSSARTPSRMYQFGLLPEDEARQAAEAAIQNDHFNAVALVPDGDWGRRMLEAFGRRFEELGGVLLGAAQYNSRATDYARPIQSVLNLDRSYARERRLQSTIQRNVRFEPRRRQDVEIVFVAAMPRQARLLEPQLEFHRAADLPAYATSHVFSGTPDPDADWDMNGLYFTEIPWLLDNLRTPDRLYRAVSSHWPAIHAQYPRLYALGIDAFSVLPHLERMGADTGSGLAGRTGRLTLDERNRIHRQLQWAWFDEGVPVAIPRPEAVDELNLDLELELDAAVGEDVRERVDGR
jgi:outer membrane PBP1 activator LpoA protein